MATPDGSAEVFAVDHETRILREQWEMADAQAHEAESTLLAAKLTPGPAGVDRALIESVLELRGQAEVLRARLEKLEHGGPQAKSP
jgi:hypothetical protein